MTLPELTESIQKAVLKKSTKADIKDEKISGFKLTNDNPLPDIHLRFERVTFLGDLDLEQIRFPKGVSFIDVDFLGLATFQLAQFDGPAYFWKCRFHRRADFFRVSVNKFNYPGSRRFAGEVNFSYCEFKEDASINRAVFAGPAFFHRTIFRRNVNFNETRFEEGATFNSTPSDICVANGEIPGESISLLSAKTLLHRSGYRKEGYYNFDMLISSRDEFARKLSRTPPKAAKRLVTFGKSRVETKPPEEQALTDEVKDRILDTWEAYYKSAMFSWQHVANFADCFFGKPSRFRHLSLRSCLLKGISLEHVEFDDVTWDNRNMSSGWPTLELPRGGVLALQFPWNARDKIYDELILRYSVDSWPLPERFSRESKPHINKTRMVISATYHELRMIYEKKGERERAREFYYGEMEMARLACPMWRRPFSLSLVYKLASGYGTQEGKAALILILLVFGIFPWGYQKLDEHYSMNIKRTSMQQLVHTELESLEASTFLRTSAGNGEPMKDLQRMTESVERIVVSLQAALFGLAVRSRFQRGFE